MQVLDKKKGITESITFRIPCELSSKLKQDANVKEESLNTLVNQIFRSYIGWHANSAKAGFMPVPKQFIILLMQKLSKEEILELVKVMVITKHQDIMMHLRDDDNFDALLDVFENFIRISGFGYSHKIVANNHCITAQIDMGANFTLFISELYKMLFEMTGAEILKVETTENTIRFSISN